MSDAALPPLVVEAPRPRKAGAGDWMLRIRHHAGILGALALFVVLYLFYQASHPRGFTGQVLTQNANEVFALALIAMAQTVPVLMAGLDLSVGAAIYMGLALILRPTPGGKVDEDLSWAVTSDVREFSATFGLFENGEAAWLQPIAWIPVPLILLAIIILVVWVPFTRSVTGRTVYAIGSSEGAAYMSGLPINRAKLAAFTMAGLFAGLGGLFLALQTSSGNADIPQAGAYTLNSIAAVVIGGTSLLGGTGSAIGSVIGALVLRTISFNFRIFDVAPLMQPLFEGIVLLAAVSLGGFKMLRLKNKLEVFR
jgi:ribose transport system permease protein